MTDDETVELLDRLFSDRDCYNCNNAYNCTGYGTPCSSFIPITKAGIIMRDWNKTHKKHLSMYEEMKYIYMSQKEIDERNQLISNK